MINNKKIAIIGFGRQGKMYYNLLKDRYNIVAICDAYKNDFLCNSDIAYFKNIDDLIEKCDFDIAILSLPHNQYNSAIIKLTQNGKHIIKDKPLSISYEDGLLYEKLCNQYKINILTVSQKKEIIVNAVRQILSKDEINNGNFTFRYEYLNNKGVSGWRADKNIAKGGILLDMGYHTFDVIQSLFGRFNNSNHNLSILSSKTLDDVFFANLSFDNKINGNMYLSRESDGKSHKLKLIFADKMIRLDIGNNKIFIIKQNEKQSFNIEDEDSCYNRILDSYIQNIDNLDFGKQNFDYNMKIVQVLDNLYKDSDYKL